MSDIKTFKNLYETTITFNNPEEFKSYYEIHKSEIDSLPTRGLNIKYHIPGYRVGRNKGEMIFFKTDTSSRSKTVEKELQDISTKLDALNNKFDVLIECLKKLMN